MGPMGPSRRLSEVVVGMNERIESLIEQQLAEQRRTNELLSLLIEALAAEEDDDGQPFVATHLDGTPV